MLEIDNTVLVMVDLQTKLVRAMHEPDRLITEASRLARAAAALEIPILWTEQNPDGLGPTVDELAGLRHGEPIAKHTFSCWIEPAFSKAITGRGRQAVLLAGIESHVCIYQSASDLIDAGFEVHVVSDAVSSRTESNRQVGLARCAAIGTVITSVESALFELLHAAGPHCPAGPEKFKEVLGIIK
jgi:nicotinamidase-related amidase